MAGTDTMLMTRPIRAGPAAVAIITCPSGRISAAADALEDAEGDQLTRGAGEPAERGSGREEHERGQVDALGSEAAGGPARHRDHGGDREHVAGDHPLDRGERRVQVAAEGVQRDVDDRRVEDRHDRPDHDDEGDPPDVALDPIGGRGRARGRRRAAAHGAGLAKLARTTVASAARLAGSEVVTVKSG